MTDGKGEHNDLSGDSKRILANISNSHTPREHIALAHAQAAIALAETQAQVLEEQRKMNGMLLALLTQQNVFDLLKIGSALDDSTEHLDNFIEHARPFPAGDDWPRCNE